MPDQDPSLDQDPEVEEFVDTDQHPGDLNPFDAPGSRMIEPDSYERIIEGLKLASDGCRHLAAWKDGPAWNLLAVLFDKGRRQIAEMGGIEAPADSVESRKILGGIVMMPAEAAKRVYSGLTDAHDGCRQMATAHRMDLRWLGYANQFRDLRDKTRDLARPMHGLAGLDIQPGDIVH